jgi:hypothetical protein
LLVSLPSGAVLVPTRITLRALATPAGTRARFAIEPAGLPLLAPATFTVTMPAAAIEPSLGLSFQSGERVSVPTIVDVQANTLTAGLYRLGFALSAAGLAATAHPGVSVESSDEFIDVQDFECQLIRDQLTDAILRAQAFSGPFPPDLVTPLILQYRAALSVCESADSLGEASTMIRQVACNNATSARTNAAVLLVSTAAELKQSLGRLIAAEGLVQETGAEDCHVPNSEFETEFNEFIQSYISRIESPGFTANFPTWDALFRELVTCIEIVALAQEYQASEAEAKIYNELLPALFARLHEVANEACSEDENGSLLGDILTAGHLLNHPIGPVPEMPFYMGFETSALQREYLTCGSTVKAECLDHFAVFAIDTATLGVNDIREKTVSSNVDGTIRLTPDFRSLSCGEVLSRLPGTVRAEAGGTSTELGVLATSLLAVPTGPTLTSLGLNSEDLPTVDLVVRRDGIPCGFEALGAPPSEMFRIHVRTVASTPRLGAPNYQGTATYGVPTGCGESVGLKGLITQTASQVRGELQTDVGDYFGSFSGRLVGNEIVDIVVTIGGCGEFGGYSAGVQEFPQGSGRWVATFELGINCGSYTLCGVTIAGGPDCPESLCGDGD